MIVELIIHDDNYPNGNSWKYGFGTISEAIEFLQENYSSLKAKGNQEYGNYPEHGMEN